MKNNLLIIFILISVITKSQTSVYHPFPDSNAVWNIQTSTQCSVATATREFFSYIMEGDTLIGGQIYHKLHEPYVIDSSGCWPYYSSGLGPGYIGGLRQEVSNRKVYFIASMDTVEHLIYDFNLHLGDTIRTFLAQDCWSGDSIISGEDSVLINGTYRKRWALNLNFGPSYIIEGIGYTGGLITHYCDWFEGGAVLSCFIQNGTLLYSDPDPYYQTNCDIINNLTSIVNNDKISIHPNPFSEIAVLEIKEPQGELNMYNLLGVNVFRKNIISISTTIEREGIPPGIYFITITNREGIIQKGKIVIE